MLKTIVVMMEEAPCQRVSRLSWQCLIVLYLVIMMPSAGAGEGEDYEGALKDGFRPALHGRVYLESAHFRDDITSMGSKVDIPVARLSVYGRIDKQWRYFAQYDLAKSRPLMDAWLQYRGSKPHLKIGQFQEPFSLEEMTSSRNITFIERALPNLFVPGYNVGGSLQLRGDNGSFTVGVFGEQAGDEPEDEGDMGFALTSRATVALFHNERRAMHLGLSGTLRRTNDEKEVRYRSRPETDLTDVRFVDTRTLRNVGVHGVVGLETALILGSWSIQGEYMRSGAAVDGVGDGDEGGQRHYFEGGYVFVSWFPGGEVRPYKVKSGGLGRVIPRSPDGALELAVRYSYLDLNDEHIRGGLQKNATFGVNWYFNPDLRLMLNYVAVRAEGRKGKTDPESPEFISTRLQFDF